MPQVRQLARREKKATMPCVLLGDKIFEDRVGEVRGSYVDDGLADGHDGVDDGHEAGGDGRDHGVELRVC